MVPTQLFAATLLPPLFDDMYERCKDEQIDLEAGTSNSTAAEQRKMFFERTAVKKMYIKKGFKKISLSISK